MFFCISEKQKQCAVRELLVDCVFNLNANSRQGRPAGKGCEEDPPLPPRLFSPLHQTCHICFIFVSCLFYICFVFASYLFHICFVFVLYMFSICFVFVSYLFHLVSYSFHICFIFVSYLFYIYPREASR